VTTGAEVTGLRAWARPQTEQNRSRTRTTARPIGRS